MRRRLVIVARLTATTVTALATIFLVAWSGGLAGLSMSPDDNSRAGFVAVSAALAGLALLPAGACIAAARPARFTLRLFALSVVTWLALATGTALDDFTGIVFLPLTGAIGATTVGVLVQTMYANTRTPGTPESGESR